MEQYVADRPGVLESGAEGQQLIPDSTLIRPRDPLLELDAEDRLLFSRLANTDQGGSKNIRVRVEDRFAGDGKKRFVLRLNPLALAPAKPEPALMIEIAEVAHPVADNRTIFDLRELGVMGSVVVLEGYLRPLDDNLPHFTGGQFQVLVPNPDGIVVDTDDRSFD